MLKPLNYNKKSPGTVLIELKERGTIETPDKQFKSFNRGIVISVATEKGVSHHKLNGKEVYFEEYKDSAQVEVNDKTFAFIALEDIRGYKDE